MGWSERRRRIGFHASAAERPPHRRARISDSDADTLCDVFVMLQRLRMAHQVAQIAAGHTPGDVITMSELSPLNRSLLNEGLREIVGVQRRVRNVGIPPG